MERIVIRENARDGSNRRAPSSITTPDTTAPLESRAQRRALRGPKTFRTAVTSRVRDAEAGPVQVLKAGKGKRKRVHKDAPGRFTRNLGGSTPCDYVYGTG